TFTTIEALSHTASPRRGTLQSVARDFNRRASAGDHVALIYAISERRLVTMPQSQPPDIVLCTLYLM
ncbi:MAG TPA: hypothetical protein VF826_06475, partial [Chloroflexia bacterium]